jgi:hypothetical protein
VHREGLVVRLRIDELEAGLRQFQAHQQRQQAADQEERECRDEVEDPDPLVVGRREPRQDVAALAADGTGVDEPAGGGVDGGHGDGAPDAGAAGELFGWLESHDSNSAGETARIVNGIREW